MVSDKDAEIPILILFYNRPAPLRELIDSLRVEEPALIYFSSDGARTPNDEPLVTECREMVNNISWPCKIVKLYSEENLGMSAQSLMAIESAIEAHAGLLVIEDDCIPVPGFFDFMRRAIKDFGNDSRVAAFCGSNPAGRTPLIGNYVYSASTRFRPWGHYIKKTHWKSYVSSGIIDSMTISRCIVEASKYSGILTKVIKLKIFLAHRRSIGNSDISMDIYFYSKGYLSLVPRENLVRNIGSGFYATHTKEIPDISLVPTRRVDYVGGGLQKLRVLRRTEVLEGWFTAMWWIKINFLSIKKILH